MDSISEVPTPVNETVRQYEPGSLHRRALESRLAQLRETTTELPLIIGGADRTGSGPELTVVAPHEHRLVLGTARAGDAADVHAAIEAATEASRPWRELSFADRAAVFLRAADLLSGPWRDTLNAATMLGQSKTVYQAEIDAACELADFWRFNVHFARQILAEQPVANAPGTWNQLDHRPLEGFVLAITPFNFTAIAGNLPTAPALMGNTVVWKPATTQLLAAHFTMRLLTAAGLPPGVINLVSGDGTALSAVALAHPDLAGIHFTGSTAVFRRLWQRVGGHLDSYRTYPRLVGETGGKGFVLAHASADPDAARTALIRGAFEYQGQKCSAGSRAYLPHSLWTRMRDELIAEIESIPMGDVADLGNFIGAVIDDRAFAKHAAAIDRARASAQIEVLAGGQYDDSIGHFVRPTLLASADPDDEMFRTEYFGPILSVHVYPDADFDTVLRRIDESSSYALTGAILGRDRGALARASEGLRFAAGNFYLNDKPTGAVVGQQPFGGARASGTNDKAGSPQNLLRWTSTRSTKETFVPATDWRYPHMER